MSARSTSEARTLPLFPLHTVLFPGGVLPLRIFEQRYIEMTKACLANDTAFGVVLIRSGDEVMRDKSRGAPQFELIGTQAKILDFDVPETADAGQTNVPAPHPGILHVRAQGRQRFSVRQHSVGPDGLIAAEITAIDNEPSRPVAASFAPLVKLLEHIAARVGPRQFPAERQFDDASWVGYRLAELLPLPPSIKQSMLEINDSEVRLSVLMRFLSDQGVL